MAYITDLIHVLHIISTLTAIRREKSLTVRIIKVAIVLYQTSQKRRDVHTTIGLFSFGDAKSELESIAKSRYTTDDDLKQKVEKITAAELEGDDDWDPPQSHGGNLTQ